MVSIPHELRVAARLDGAGEFTILCKVVLLLSWPVIAVLTIFRLSLMKGQYYTPVRHGLDRHDEHVAALHHPDVVGIHVLPALLYPGNRQHGYVVAHSEAGSREPQIKEVRDQDSVHRRR
jgi:ABC-type polysaccharide transport system permease subunit